MESKIGVAEVVTIVTALTRIPVVGDFLRSLIESFVGNAGPNTDPEHKSIADDVLRNIGPNVTRDWLKSRERQPVIKDDDDRDETTKP